jgi:hypothetical protein
MGYIVQDDQKDITRFVTDKRTTTGGGYCLVLYAVHNESNKPSMDLSDDIPERSPHDCGGEPGAETFPKT